MRNENRIQVSVVRATTETGLFHDRKEKAGALLSAIALPSVPVLRRDVIRARRNAGVKTSKARGEHFDNLIQLNLQGIPIEVPRGWTQVNATVRGSKHFRFVNTHLRMRQPQEEVPSLPAKQVG